MRESQKGALYIHFSSKNELLIEIYRYYLKKVKVIWETIDNDKGLDRKERLQAQIKNHMEKLLSQKEFILMHFNKNGSYCKELDAFLQTVKEGVFKWYEERLIGIYGEEVRPYVTDLTIILKGMIESYLMTLFFSNVSLTLEDVSDFIISRLDDLVEGLVRKKENPPFLHVRQSLCGEMTWRQQLDAYFLQLEKMIVDSLVEDEVKEGIVSFPLNF